jgi:hypothetical protein
MSRSPNTLFLPAAKPARSPGRPTTYRDVLRVLQSDAARSGALMRYRAAGFTADDFATRRNARETMADALSRTEDVLEGVRGAHAQAERAVIRDVRRRLEIEVEVHP